MAARHPTSCSGTMRAQCGTLASGKTMSRMRSRMHAMRSAPASGRARIPSVPRTTPRSLGCRRAAVTPLTVRERLARKGRHRWRRRREQRCNRPIVAACSVIAVRGVVALAGFSCRCWCQRLIPALPLRALCRQPVSLEPSQCSACNSFHIVAAQHGPRRIVRGRRVGNSGLADFAAVRTAVAAVGCRHQRVMGGRRRAARRLRRTIVGAHGRSRWSWSRW